MKLRLMEAGISKPGEMDKLEKIIRPDTGIITNLGAAHQENFSSLKQKAEEKLLLFRDSENIIYCSDYPEITEIILKMYPSKNLLSWGKAGDPDYLISTIKDGNTSMIKVQGQCRCSFQIPFRDSASVENAVHVFVFLHSSGYSTDFIVSALEKLEPVAMRMEILKGLNDCTIINDSYNSDLVSLSNAIDFLNLQQQHNKKTLILSDILQSGKPAEMLYREVASIIKTGGVDNLIGIGKDIASYRKYFGNNSDFFPDTGSFLREYDLSRFRNEAVLLKGSRSFRFELISSALQEKAHRTVMEIDLNALVHNYQFYKSLLRPKTRLMAMVKAFSYGSGGYEIASILQYHKVDYLAVAFTDEGVSLRKNGIRIPVMVMNPEKNDFPLLTANRLEPEIYNFRILSSFRKYLLENGISSYPVHIKIDTGMHRLGFQTKDTESLCMELRESPFKVVSVFSHLAAADEPALDEFSRRQIADFRGAAEKIRAAVKEDFMRHILNSAGIERFPEAGFEMVRLGIGLYGVSSFMQDKLQEVSGFKTRVAQIMEVAEGESIGYGRKGGISGRGRIATLPVGYADGLPRSLGNGKASFLLNEKLVPTVGNICMDMCMVDISNVEAREGDEVEIFGKHLPVSNLAAAADTIPYEILTNISARVKRIYYRE